MERKDIQNNTFGFLTDRGGRRRLKDRRFLMAGPPGPERRKGLRRRSGLDRRFFSGVSGMRPGRSHYYK